MVSNGPFTADEQKNMCICGCLEEIGATCPSYKLACGHISHIECFPSYINSKLQETKVPCPSPGCQKDMIYSDLIKLVDPLKRTELEKMFPQG